MSCCAMSVLAVLACAQKVLYCVVLGPTTHVCDAPASSFRSCHWAQLPVSPVLGRERRAAVCIRGGEAADSRSGKDRACSEHWVMACLNRCRVLHVAPVRYRRTGLAIPPRYDFGLGRVWPMRESIGG